jgi:ornithine lipid hydroxylase
VIGGLWGAIFAGGLGAVYAAIAVGYDGATTLAIVTVVAGALLIALERLAPLQRDWLVPDGEWWPDLGHLVVGFGFGTFAGTWLAQAMVVEPWWPVWPHSWPLLLEVILGLVVAEFFYYWQHRAVHTIPALWPLHALHHDTERMTFFKTTRIHALDIGSATFFSVASLLILGAPVSVVLWVTAFGNFAAQTQHANVRLTTPAWLNSLVGTPTVHWLHHSRDKREGNSNFSMNVMLWDHVFGTYIAPSAEPQTSLGIEPGLVPRTFTGQLLMPLRALLNILRRN